MSDLVGFLLARIADEETVARDWAPQLARGHAPVVVHGGAGYRRLASPAHVLAECAARRRIVELHAPRYAVVYRESERLLAEAFDQDKVRVVAGSGPLWMHPASEQTLLALAQPYAGHPDFHPSWRLT